MITAADIPWGAPVAKPERMPARLLAEMSDAQLLRYCFSMQDDIESLRVTLHETLHALAAKTRECETVRARYHDARDELRRLREERRG